MIAHLRVVTGEGLLRDAPVLRVPTLEAQPVRPGEMPEVLLVELGAEAAARTASEVERTGVPTPLWLRLAVEAARHVFAAAARGGISPEQIIGSLDEAAAGSAGSVRAVQSRRHCEYARLLRTASSRRRDWVMPSRYVEVAAPDALLTAWALEAAQVAVDLSEFVSARVVEAPLECVTWEAAAAEEGRSLAEWIYAQTLALTAR